ncbi:MAG: hypothetical protein KAS32_03120, partial [Candidatus Peribacteraceae bacterium]|nr:hypothetical protein [Candidatus Peribacteraceae bacterium]
LRTRTSILRYIKPKQSHEDNLKVELAKWAQQSGLHLHMEYIHKNCRFDCVLVREQEILAIIEIKNWNNSKAYDAKEKPTKQLRKYMRHNIPVLVLYDFKGTKGLISRMKTLVGNYDRDKAIHPMCLQFFPSPNNGM